MKKARSVMKEVIGKMHQHSKSELPCNPFVDEKYMILQTEVAKKFNDFFTDISPSLGRKIPTPIKFLESFLKKGSTALPKRCLTKYKLKEVFFSLKIKNSAGADEI